MRLGMRLSLLLALLMTACSAVVQEIAPPIDIAEVALVASQTPTLMPTATAVPTPTPEALQVGMVSYRGLRFQYDPSIASSVRGAIIPAFQGATPEFDLPEHLRFIFDEIALSNTFSLREPQLLVFPIDDFRMVSNIQAENALEALTELLAEKPLKPERDMLLMPPVAGKSVLQVHARYIRFEYGEGVRFLAAYVDEDGMVTNDDLFYIFQGVSFDGEYFISLFFPIDTAELPASVEDFIASDDYSLFSTSYDSYLAETVELLAGIQDRNFTPNLNLLDSMIKSLQLPDASIELRQVSDPERITDRIRREGKAGLRALWRDLGISSPLFEAPGDLNLELFDMKVNGSQDEYRFLLISDTNELDWQYLLFRSAGNRWLFVGHVDLARQKFLPPACRIVQGKNEAWWVFTWLEQAGPGVTHYRETWYSFSEDSLQAVLSFPLEGYQISADYAYNVIYRGDLAPEEDAHSNSFRLIYHLSYAIQGDGEGRTTPVETYKLFEIERSVLYIWDDQARRFVLVPEASQLNQEQMDAVFYFPGPDSTFLQFAGEELAQVAQNGTDLQKRWLLRFLESLEASLDVEEFKIRIGG
jgi:hypothetical protein